MHGRGILLRALRPWNQRGSPFLVPRQKIASAGSSLIRLETERKSLQSARKRQAIAFLSGPGSSFCLLVEPRSASCSHRSFAISWRNACADSNDSCDSAVFLTFRKRFLYRDPYQILRPRGDPLVLPVWPAGWTAPRLRSKRGATTGRRPRMPSGHFRGFEAGYGRITSATSRKVRATFRSAIRNSTPIRRGCSVIWRVDGVTA